MEQNPPASSLPRRPVHPTGNQYEIRMGSHEAVVTQVGATLRRYTVEGEDVLDPFGEEEVCDSHGQTLIPWPNRIANGAYRFAGKEQMLPINQPGDQAAIHGLVRFLSWEVVQQSESSITLAHTLWPSTGYPFSLHAEACFTLDGTGLSVNYQTTNVGTEPLPVGIGTHPYFTVGTPTVDTAILKVPAKTMLVTDENGIPTGRQTVTDTPFDFLSPRQIGDTVLDTAYTDLIPDDDGLVRISLAAPNRGRSLRVQLDPAARFVQVYSADTLPNPATHRRSLAIEPMTCPANAFNSKEGLATLEPGEALKSGWRVDPD